MKNLFLVIMTFSLSWSFAQTESLSTTPATVPATSTLGASLLSQPEMVQRIQQIEERLAAIQIKWDIIENDPEEKAIAESQGWFEFVKDMRAKLLVEKTELEAQLQ